MTPVATQYSMTEALEVGRDVGTPVSEHYQIPFSFAEEVGKVIVKLQ